MDIKYPVTPYRYRQLHPFNATGRNQLTPERFWWMMPNAYEGVTSSPETPPSEIWKHIKSDHYFKFVDNELRQQFGVPLLSGERIGVLVETARLKGITPKRFVEIFAHAFEFPGCYQT